MRNSDANSGQFCHLCGAWRGCLGLEPTPDLFVAHMVEVMRDVWRVMRDDAVAFINLGDSFQDKQLLGIPWRVAFALQADGWWLRSDIIWAKGLSFCPTYSGSVMPESVRDRPTSAYEHVFLLSKSKRYFYDAEAVKEKGQPESAKRYAVPFHVGTKETAGQGRPGEAANTPGMKPYSGTRNLRNVWTINPAGFPGAHFATFPPALVEPCIKAGTSERGCCPECGAPWTRVVVATGHVNKREPAHCPNNCETKTDSTGWAPTTVATDDWRPGCDCDTGLIAPAVVLDPFFGAGTTGLVARSLGRDCIGIELSEAYIEMARRRLDGVTELEVTNGDGEVMAMEQGTMFSTVTVS